MQYFSNEPIFFVSAKRTPFGTYLGSLKKLSATDLGLHASSAALQEANIPLDIVEQVIFGNVLQTSNDAIYLARHIALRSELPIHTPALTVNRLCGSGFEAITQGARLIKTKEAQCVLVGGSESLSQAPFIIRGARTGISLGKGVLEDYLWASLTDSFINMPMAITAENLAQKYEITQNEVDNYSLRSQKLYSEALNKNIFHDEIAPMLDILERDEHPKPNSSLEAFSKLPKVFKKDGVIHAASASGICDGAAALVMCNESIVKKYNLKPLGELVNFSVSGCDPKIMGIGPVPAIRQVLEKSQNTISDMAMIEVNEAFAPQVLAVQKELSLPINKLNIHGGGLAIGHPLAASGARITAHLLHTLKNQPNKLGLGSACIGGGQGIALIIRSL